MLRTTITTSLAMLLRPLRLLAPKYVVTKGMTAYGPAIDIHRDIFGWQFRVSDATFAREASRYIDAQVAPTAVARPSDHSVPVRRALSAPQPLRAKPVSAKQTVPPQPVRTQSLPTSITGPSPAWQARCAKMMQPNAWAETPEVQAAAHLFDARIRVFTRTESGQMAARFVANRWAQSHTLDLVLENGHYRWVPGCVPGRVLPADKVLNMAQDVPGDGSCFFHCLARGIPGLAGDVQILRQVVVDKVRLSEKDVLDGSEGIRLGDAFA